MWKIVLLVVLLVVNCFFVQCNEKKSKILEDSEAEGSKKKGLSKKNIYFYSHLGVEARKRNLRI